MLFIRFLMSPVAHQASPAVVCLGSGATKICVDPAAMMWRQQVDHHVPPALRLLKPESMCWLVCSGEETVASAPAAHHDSVTSVIEMDQAQVCICLAPIG